MIFSPAKFVFGSHVYMKNFCLAIIPRCATMKNNPIKHSSFSVNTMSKISSKTWMDYDYSIHRGTFSSLTVLQDFPADLPQPDFVTQS